MTDTATLKELQQRKWKAQQRARSPYPDVRDPARAELIDIIEQIKKLRGAK